MSRETPDLTEVIDALVSARVEQILAPYRELLDRLAAFAGQAPARADRPSRAAGAAVADQKPKGRHQPRGRPVQKHARAGKGVSIGSKVQFRQGRGLFSATVESIDADSGIVTLMRESDGKRFERRLDTLKA